MAKSKIEIEIEDTIRLLEQEANILYHQRKEVLAKIEVLYSLIKK